MTLYPRIRLGDIVTIKGGKRLRPSEDFSTEPTPHPYIRARDVGGGIVKIQDAVYLPEDVANRLSRYRVTTGDVCITIVGANVGEMGIVPPNLDGANLTENCVRLTNNGKVTQGFVRYALLGEDAQGQMKVLAGGAAQPKLGIYKIETVEIFLPSLPTQRKIASILSAYDDLIENNTRRIAILEEMAQAIYREWFVNFRFPGHENVKLVDSPLGQIPEGWEATSLGEHLLQLESGKRPRGGVGKNATGVPSVGAENIRGIGKHNYLAEKHVPVEFFKKMRKGVVADKDVALYKDGAYIGRSSCFRDHFPHDEFCVNEHVFLLRPNGESLTSNFLYTWLQQESTVGQIRGANANAAQPGINQKTTKGLKLVLPDKRVMQHFDSLIDPFYAGLIVFAKRNTVLRTTRDILLPKLISGKLDVEDLDIDMGTTADELEDATA